METTQEKINALNEKIKTLKSKDIKDLSDEAKTKHENEIKEFNSQVEKLNVVLIEEKKLKDKHITDIETDPRQIKKYSEDDMDKIIKKRKLEHKDMETTQEKIDKLITQNTALLKSNADKKAQDIKDLEEQKINKIKETKINAINKALKDNNVIDGILLLSQFDLEKIVIKDNGEVDLVEALKNVKDKFPSQFGKVTKTGPHNRSGDNTPPATKVEEVEQHMKNRDNVKALSTLFK